MMEELCLGETPWNLDQLWNTSLPRFNRCFQRTVPIWLPSLLLWLVAPIEVFQIVGLTKTRTTTLSRPIGPNLYNRSRLFTVGCIVLVNLVWFAYDCWYFVWPSVWHARVSMADLTGSALKVSTFILFGFVINLHRKHGMHTSGLAFTYLFASLVLSMPSLYMFFMFLDNDSFDDAHSTDEPRNGVPFWDPVEFGLFVTHFLLLIVTFLFTCFADRKFNDSTSNKKSSANIDQQQQHQTGYCLKPLLNSQLVGSAEDSTFESLVDCPEQSVSFLSMITYWWFNGLMALGYRKCLTLDNLWKLNPDYCAGVVGSKFDRNWKAQKSPGTVRTLVKTFGGQLAVGAFLKLVHLLLSFVNPLLLKFFIGFISNPSEPVWHGYVFVALFFTASIAQSLSSTRYYHQMMLIGMQTRTSLVSAIYRKSLCLSTAALSQSTTGEILNLMSVDSQRFELLFIYLNLVWAIPVQVGLTIYFLYRELGPSVLVGFGVMALMLPLNVAISKIQQRLQTKQMAQKDKRVKLLNEVLNGIRVIKLYAWELAFTRPISTIRHTEMGHLEHISYINAVTSILWNFSPFIVSFVTFGVYVHSSSRNELDPQKAFVSLALFESLRYPLTILSDMITNLVLARVAVKRLNRFFNLDQLQQYVKREDSVEWAIEIKNGTFAWEEEKEVTSEQKLCRMKNLKIELQTKQLVIRHHVTLNGINIKVKKGSLVAIVGRVSSGKSSLLSAILGDLQLLVGSVNIDPNESVSYVAQQAWILNATLRENILFGSRYVQSRYDSMLDMCALGPGVKDLESAKDLKSAKVLENVKNLESAKDLKSAKVLENVKDLESAKDLKSAKDLDNVKDLKGVNDEKNEKAVKEKLTTTESTATGHVKWSVYLDYFRSLSTLWLVTLLVGYIGMQIAYVWSNVWLALWSNDYKRKLMTRTGGNGTMDGGDDGRNYRLAIYGVLGAAQGTLFFIGALGLARGTVASSSHLHRTQLDRIMRSPTEFFDTTPLGRIVNRFSKDIDTLDTIIPITLDKWLICILQVVSTFGLIAFQVPIFMAVAVPILLLYFYIQQYCLATSRQLKRLESVTRSPIYSHFGESLQGLATIRAFSATRRFIAESNSRLDTNLRCYFPGFIFNRWIALRLEFCGNLIVLFTALASVAKRDDFRDAPGHIGLLMVYSLAFTTVLNHAVRMATVMESNIVAVERIREYCHIKTEQSWNRQTDEHPRLEEDWPQKGAIEFKGYSVRYRDGLKRALRRIDLKIDAGQKIAIVGRTGAGKSSLALALFRILEATSGKIVIDGVEIGKIGLHELRSRLSIIPQDPTLFSGSIRSNLDPFGQCTDERLWQVLEQSHLKEYVTVQDSGLDHTVAENGSNLSVGQRQLVCLARVLLRKRTTILVLDEATASIDLSTDTLIQRTIRAQFVHSTVLTIAHRLNTVVDSDRVLVLERRKVVEFGIPADLLNDRGSRFYSLAKDAGLV